MTSLWTNSRIIREDLMDDPTILSTRSQEEVRRDLEGVIGKFGARKVTNPKLQTIMAAPTMMTTTDPQKEIESDWESKPYEMITDFFMRRYPGSLSQKSALINAYYSMEQLDEIWKYYEHEWRTILMLKNAKMIEKMIHINKDHVLINNMYETTPTIWIMKLGKEIIAINVMTTFGLVLSQHPQINRNHLGQSIIDIMEQPHIELKDIIFDNLNAIAIAQRYEFKIIENPDKKDRNGMNKIMIRMKQSQIGVKVQNREGPIEKLEMPHSMKMSILNEYKHKREMAIKARMMAKRLKDLADPQNNPVYEACDDLLKWAKYASRKADRIDGELAELRKTRSTDTNIQIFVSNKTDTIRPLSKQDIENERNIIYWIGRKRERIMDKLNVWFKIHIEIRMNGHCNRMERTNEYGAGTFAINGSGGRTALPPILPITSWDGQIKARKISRTNYYQNILQILQRQCDDEMNHIQKMKFIQDKEVWTAIIDWKEGIIEIYEATELMKNAARYGKNWEQRMLELAEEQGIYDYHHGNFKMNIKQNLNYEGFYQGSKGPQSHVRINENQYWIDYERKMREGANSGSNSRSNNQSFCNHNHNKLSTGPGVQRRMVLHRFSGQRPAPLSTTNRSRGRRQQHNQLRSSSQSRSRSRSRSKGRNTTTNEEMETSTFCFESIGSFCKKLGIDLNKNKHQNEIEYYENDDNLDKIKNTEEYEWSESETEESSSSQRSMSGIRMEGEINNINTIIPIQSPTTTQNHLQLNMNGKSNQNESQKELYQEQNEQRLKLPSKPTQSNELNQLQDKKDKDKRDKNEK